MVSGTRCPYVSVYGYKVVRGAAAPKGSMTYAFTHMGNFLPLLLLLESGLLAGIWTSRLRFWPQGWDLGLQARIWALRLGFGHQGWDLGLETGIWASRLGFEGGG